MASENAKIDDNEKPVAMAITDDANQYRKMLRIDDTTKGLKVMLVGGTGAGTVTSISQGTGILATPNPIIGIGTIALSTPLQPIATLAGNSLKVLRVNAGETAVEYASVGAGTVTSVSVTTANGVSGSVATATTTPAITFTLGAITPSTVNGNTITTGTGVLTLGAGKTFTASNTITLTATDGSTLAIGTGGTLGTAAYTASTAYATSTQGTTADNALPKAGGTMSGNIALKTTTQVVTAMGAQALDGSLGNVFTRTLGANETFTQSNFTTGQFFIVKVKQGSGTSYTVTWFATVTWITSGGTAPTQTTTSNGYTTYGFQCTGSNTFDGYLVGTQ